MSSQLQASPEKIVDEELGVRVHPKRTLSPVARRIVKENQEIGALKTQLHIQKKQLLDQESARHHLEEIVRNQERKYAQVQEECRFYRTEFEKKQTQQRNLQNKYDHLLQERERCEKELKKQREYVGRLEIRLVQSTQSTSPTQRGREVHAKGPVKNAVLGNSKSQAIVSQGNVGSGSQAFLQRIRELEEENDAFRYEIKMLSSSLEIEKEYQENPSLLAKELAEAREKCARQAQTEEEIRQQFLQVDAQLREHERAVEEYKVLRESDAQELTQNERLIQELTQESKKFRTENAQLTQTLDELQSTVERMQRELSELEASERAKQQNADNVLQLQQLNRDLQNKVNVLQTLLDESQDKVAEAEAFREQFQSYRAKHKDLQIRYNSVLSDLQQAHLQIRALEQHSGELQTNQRVVGNRLNSFEAETQQENREPNTSTLVRHLQQQELRLRESKASTVLAVHQIQQKKRDELIQLLIDSQEEVSRLKESLEEAIETAAAQVMIEKELRVELSKREQQIENIVNSRNLMQKNLGEQLHQLKEKFKETDIESKKLKEENYLSEQEILALRELLRKYEKERVLKK